MSALAEPILVTLEVTAALEQLGALYLVGGSLASSLHGIPRSTQDIDLLVELPGKHVDRLAELLEDRFYVDRDMMHDAVLRRSSFNLLHLATMFKVDVFVSDRGELAREEMARRQRVEVGTPPQPIWVCSAEDIVVQKLDWFEKGDRISERQWGDLIGVLRVGKDKLDQQYMRRWAAHLGVLELLESAVAEAG